MVNIFTRMAGSWLTREFIVEFYKKISEFSCPATENQCINFTGTRQGGYGILSKTIKGQRHRVYAHRIVCLYNMGVIDLPDGTEVSHLCHNKCCVNTAHLSVEAHAVNNSRKNCFQEQRCTKNHENLDGSKLPDCILN